MCTAPGNVEARKGLEFVASHGFPASFASALEQAPLPQAPLPQGPERSFVYHQKE